MAEGSARQFRGGGISKLAVSALPRRSLLVDPSSHRHRVTDRSVESFKIIVHHREREKERQSIGSGRGRKKRERDWRSGSFDRSFCATWIKSNRGGENTMEKEQPDSLATVAVVSEKMPQTHSHYAPSEVYSSAEPPPVSFRLRIRNSFLIRLFFSANSKFLYRTKRERALFVIIFSKEFYFTILKIWNLKKS